MFSQISQLQSGKKKPRGLLGRMPFMR
jgi:hypothetical protein